MTFKGKRERKGPLVKKGLPDSASSPVARDLWGIFELIIKESGYEGSDGKGTPLALYSRSHHPFLALLACLACSRVPHLDLGESPWSGQIKASFSDYSSLKELHGPRG